MCSFIKTPGDWSTAGGSADGEFQKWSCMICHFQLSPSNVPSWAPLAAPGSPPPSPSPSSRRSMEHSPLNHLTLKRSTWRYIIIYVCVKVNGIKCNLNKYNLLGKVAEISNSCTWSLTSGQYCQAFRYFGWLTMAPLLVLHCLLCCTAFQMGENLHKIWFLMEEWRDQLWFKYNRKEKPTFDSSVHHAPGLPGSLPTGEQQPCLCQQSQTYLAFVDMNTSLS